ncbi:MAG TPA: GNAT family N-acetyltransferase [Solirubrobacteraceae bacterium]|nr:GNAT family N-acetyltransferase [Solirubrobacteraceae bacterium]
MGAQPQPANISFRDARAADAQAVAELHADSWRRSYRGAYADSFLDGDVVADRVAVWSDRLAVEDVDRVTILAEGDGLLVGFANAYRARDPEWGALLENLHVREGHRRGGIGRELMERTAAALAARAPREGLYLWVLEQNSAAQQFYGALGGVCTERAAVEPPGGVAGRLAGTPSKLRFAWRDAGALVAGTARR